MPIRPSTRPQNLPRLLCLAASLVATFPALLRADTAYNDGNSHDITTAVSGLVSITNNSQATTTVNVMPGGSVTAANSSGNLDASGITLNSGVLNLSGGLVVGASATSSSTSVAIKIKGGAANILSGTVNAGTANIGGTASGIELIAGSLTISGGSINAGTVTGGGGVFGVHASGGTVNINAGSFTAGSASGGGAAVAVQGETGSIINIRGGTYTGGHAPAGNWAEPLAVEGGTMNIYDAVVLAGGGGRGDGVAALGGTINIYGGSIAGDRTLDSLDNTGLINVYGGQLASGSGAYLENGSINIYGSNFNFPYGTVSATSGTLTGTLSDGHALNLSLHNSGAGHIVLIQTPEPSSLALLALAAAPLLNRRRKR